MSGVTFAAHARRAPNPCNCAHPNFGAPVTYNCHMAAMHWAFMDLGDDQAMANRRVEAIASATCLMCRGLGGPGHATVLNRWYGSKFCQGAVRIATRAELYGAVHVGDVLVTGPPQAPPHSMVVVSKRSLLGRTSVYIRGFNNTGTFGPPSQSMAYDGSDRDVDRAILWQVLGAGNEVFGGGAGGRCELYRIPCETYMRATSRMRGFCPQTPGGIVYNGPLD